MVSYQPYAFSKCISMETEDIAVVEGLEVDYLEELKDIGKMDEEPESVEVVSKVKVGTFEERLVESPLEWRRRERKLEETRSLICHCWVSHCLI